MDNGLLLVDFFIMDNDFGLWTKEASDKWTKKINPALSQIWVPPSPQGDNPPGLTPLWTGGGLQGNSKPLFLITVRDEFG